MPSTELLKNLLGLDAPGTLFSADADVQKRMAMATTRVVLADIVGQFQKFWNQLGPGVLVVRISLDDAIWSDPDDIKEQIALARSADMHSFAESLEDMLQKLGTIDPEQEAFIAIADHTGLRVMRIPADNPSQQIEEMLKEWK